MALTEGKRAGDFIQSLAAGDRSKENITVKSGANVVSGEVLGNVLTLTQAADAGNTGDGTMGAVTAGADIEIGIYNVECTGIGPGVASTGTGAAVAGNTGNGTITASPATGANAKVGTYMITCVGVDANAGEFQVEDPDGIVLGIAVVGAEFTAGTHLTFTLADGSTDFDEGDAFTIVVAAADSGTFKVETPAGISLGNATVGTAFASTHIGFTIADGSTDFAVGDKITVTVALGKYVALAFAGTDGSQIAWGISYDAYDASSADKTGVAIGRDAEVNSSELTWPSGATAAQKAQAERELNARGVYLR